MDISEIFEVMDKYDTVDPNAMPQENPTARVCPSNLGGMNGIECVERL